MALVLSTVRSTLATRAETISGLRSFDYVPDNMAPPCALFEPSGFSYHGAMGQTGLAMFGFNCHVLVSRSSDRAGQLALDAYCDTASTTSIPKTLEGITDFTVVVRTLTAYGEIEVAGVPYYGATFALEVIG